MKHVFTVTTFLLFTTLASAETRSFRTAAVEIGGAKFWLPSTFVVKKGDEVVIQAVSKVTGAPGTTAHGFAIPAYNVEEVVDTKGKEVRFKADRAGIFPINCQMHPAHFGGQLVVLE